MFRGTLVRLPAQKLGLRRLIFDAGQLSLEEEVKRRLLDVLFLFAKREEKVGGEAVPLLYGKWR